MASHSLCRILSKRGIMSRKQAAAAITAGRVAVNGQAVKDPGWITAEGDDILVDGERAMQQKFVYLLLNKPHNCITSRTDPEGRRTVYDLVKYDTWLAPVGRLDYDTSGLLIMTNDGKFADYVADPNSNLWKTYVAKIKGTLTNEDIEKLKSGIQLKEGKTKPASAKVLSSTGLSSRIELKIHEGKNRQARRMLESLGKKVISLSRTAIGDLSDGSLMPGQYRQMTPAELNLLKRKE